MATVTKAFQCLMFCWLCVFVEGKEKPKKPDATPALVLTLATMLAGEYQNQEPNSDPGSSNLVQNFRFVPVIVPVLEEAVTFYYEQRYNNELEPNKKQIYAFILETPTTIRQSVYNIENPEKFSLDQTKSLKDLEDLQLSELSSRPECDNFWLQLDDELFTASFATDKCVHNIQGIEIRADGTRNLTCSMMTINEVFRKISDDEILVSTSNPVVLDKIDNPFPVPVRAFNRNKCFEAPCTGKNRRKTKPVWGDIKRRLRY